MGRTAGMGCTNGTHFWMYGGSTAAGVTSEFWAFDGVDWSLISSTSAERLIILPGLHFLFISFFLFSYFCSYLYLYSVFPAFQDTSSSASPGARAFGGMFYMMDSVFIMGGEGMAVRRMKRK